jgi:hypothetical protein
MSSSTPDTEDKFIGEHIQGRHDWAGISLHDTTRSAIQKYNRRPTQAADYPKQRPPDVSPLMTRSIWGCLRISPQQRLERAKFL